MTLRGIEIMKELNDVNPAGKLRSCKLISAAYVIQSSLPVYKNFCEYIPKPLKKSCNDRVFGRINWVAYKGSGAAMLTTTAVITITAAMLF